MTIGEFKELIKQYQPSLVCKLFCYRRTPKWIRSLIDFSDSLLDQDQNKELTEAQRIHVYEIISNYTTHKLYDALVKKMGSSYFAMLQILENELFIASKENLSLLFRQAPAQVAKLDNIFQQAIYAHDVRDDGRPLDDEERKNLFVKTVAYIDDSEFTKKIAASKRLSLVGMQQVVEEVAEDCEADKAANVLMSLASNDSHYGALDTVRIMQTYLTARKTLRSLPAQPHIRNLR